MPGRDYIILGQAAVKRPGGDVTLIGYGSGFYLCREAAQELAEVEIEAEVMELRTLKPLDMDTVADSIKKTLRAVIVHEACLTGGFGGELAARIQEELFATWMHRSRGCGQGCAHPFFTSPGRLRAAQGGRRGCVVCDVRSRKWKKMSSLR